MNFFKHLVGAASTESKIIDFYYFVAGIHQMIDYEKPDCDSFLFLTPLKEVLLWAEKSYDEQRELLILHCILARVFHSMFQWKSNMDHTNVVIERLKILRKGQKKIQEEEIMRTDIVESLIALEKIQKSYPWSI